MAEWCPVAHEWILVIFESEDRNFDQEKQNNEEAKQQLFVS